MELLVMAYVDEFGLTVTLDSPAAVATWNQTVHGVLAHAASTPCALSAVREEAPEFALGHAMRGLCCMILARGELVRPLEAYASSVHARALEGGQAGADCGACHGSHDIMPAADSRSSVHHANVVATCTQCHAEIAAVYGKSPEDTWAQVEAASTIGRTVRLDEIAAMAVYLASPLADGVNGQSLAVDGGIVYG